LIDLGTVVQNIAVGCKEADEQSLRSAVILIAHRNSPKLDERSGAWRTFNIHARAERVARGLSDGREIENAVFHYPAVDAETVSQFDKRFSGKDAVNKVATGAMLARCPRRGVHHSLPFVLDGRDIRCVTRQDHELGQQEVAILFVLTGAAPSLGLKRRNLVHCIRLDVVARRQKEEIIWRRPRPVRTSYLALGNFAGSQQNRVVQVKQIVDRNEPISEHQLHPRRIGRQRFVLVSSIGPRLSFHSAVADRDHLGQVHHLVPDLLINQTDLRQSAKPSL